VSDLSKLQKFLDDSYRESYLEAHVKGSIAYQIQALREQASLNQTEFGELIGKPQSVVSRIESTEYGGANVNTLIEIANRLKIGLQIRFCDFETVLSANLSPEGLKVENIQQTISRLQAPVTTHLTNTSVTMVRTSSSTGTIQAWQTQQIPNQPQSQMYPGSGTLNFERYTPTQVSPAYHLST
jgi:transcriptional regulator with XRE-family HTH domain